LEELCYMFNKKYLNETFVLFLLLLITKIIHIPLLLFSISDKTKTNYWNNIENIKWQYVLLQILIHGYAKFLIALKG